MTVRFDLTDGVARVTLDRPDAFNALDDATIDELFDVSVRLWADSSVRAVLLRGEGRAFSGGGDVKTFASRLDADPESGEGLPAQLKRMTTPLHGAISNLVRLDAPVIAVVHGSAAGAGMSLAMACDLVLAAEGTKFTMAYTSIGLAPDGSSTWFLPRRVGLGRALDLTLTNRVIDAQEAATLGIVTRVVAADDLVAEADALAAQLAAGPTRAFGEAKRLLYASLGNGLETQMELESRAIASLGRTADGREGIAAFTQKRKPDFHGT